MVDELAGPHPERIGPYRILGVIGEGGMGVVFEAEQTEPVRRRVAIKMLKLGLDTMSVLARFEAERQALAVMDHPCIATILDGGATEGGRPYFVMELVEGAPLTAYADDHELGLRERVRLAVEACEAVQHAHQKGVIHRDLKPSNILVTEVGGRPTCRVIDFGVARAVDYEEEDGGQLTRLGQRIGTPAYMSPEQILDDSAAIDTRTDIYALGVVLYELLSGALPREKRVYQSAAIMAAVLEEPPAPSGRFTALSDTQETVARVRRTDPAALRRHLRGDLDWIVMKAMATERDRRYETANGLALDLGRYLRGEPVRARPPSASYRVRKFVGRNRAAVVASVAALLALLGGLVGTVNGYVQASRERDRTAAVNEYLVQEVLSAPNPTVDGNEVRVVEVLDRAAGAVGETFAGQPDLEADIRVTLARTYRGLGRYESAEEHARIAHDLRTELYGENDPATTEALDRIGRALLGQDRFDEAIDVLSRTAVRLEAELGAEHPSTLDTKLDLAASYARSGRFDEAIELERAALDVRRRVEGDDADLTSETKVSLGATLLYVGDTEEAEELYRSALEQITARHGDQHVTAIGAMNGLANLYVQIGDAEQGESFGRRSWEAARVVYGEDHPEAVIALNEVASALRQARRFDEAEVLSRQVAELYEQRLGPRHQWTMNAVHNHAATLARLDRLDEAERIHIANLENRRAVLGERSDAAAQSLSGLGIVYANAGRPLDAIGVYDEAVEIYRERFGDEHPELATTLSNLSRVQLDAGRPEDAAATLRRLVELDTDAVGPTHRWVLQDYRDLIGALVRFDLVAAEAAARERLARTTAGLAPDDPGHLESLLLVGGTLAQQGRHGEAEPIVVEAFEGLMAALGGEDGLTRNAADALARIYDALGRSEEAERYWAMVGGRGSG